MPSQVHGPTDSRVQRTSDAVCTGDRGDTEDCPTDAEWRGEITVGRNLVDGDTVVWTRICRNVTVRDTERKERLTRPVGEDVTERTTVT